MDHIYKYKLDKNKRCLSVSIFGIASVIVVVVVVCLSVARLRVASLKWTAFVFGNTYFHKTFTECVSNQYANFDVSICQM